MLSGGVVVSRFAQSIEEAEIETLLARDQSNRRESFDGFRGLGLDVNFHDAFSCLAVLNLVDSTAKKTSEIHPNLLGHINQLSN